jgi:xanthine/uracil permease
LIDSNIALHHGKLSTCFEVCASNFMSNARGGGIKLKTKGKEIGVPERPAELIYALDEIPPLPHLLGLGFQHVAVICPYLVMVVLVAEAAKLPHTAAQSAISLAMIAVAYMTVLQSLRLGPLGSGCLCPPVVTAIYLPSSLAVAASLGISAVCGMVIFASACEIAVASLVNHTRKLFPAVVSGVVIMAVGLEIGKIAAGVLLEHTTAHSNQTVASFVTAVCTLATMAGLAVWAAGLPKLFCSLIGILIGYAVAAIVHVFRQASSRTTGRRAYSLCPTQGFYPMGSLPLSLRPLRSPDLPRVCE